MQRTYPDTQYNTQIINTIRGAEGINRFPWNVAFKLVGAVLLYENCCNFGLAKKTQKYVGRGKPFQPGNSGRPSGTPNKLTRTVKETVLAVFNDLQSDPKVNLESWAKNEPTEFYRIAAKLIPTEITGTVKTVIKVSESE